MSQHPTSELASQLLQNEEWAKAQRGEMYRAFIPELVEVRDRCSIAVDKFNTMTDRTRRNTVKAWRDITANSQPLPPVNPDHRGDASLFERDPWVCAPVHADYGFNVILGEGTFINYNATFVDTCPITIGARTLTGPNCSYYSGGHPLDPAVRQGLVGPEFGKPITIGEDCWLGGNVTVLPGVTIGRGSTVGAGSVVTKDVPPFHVVVGNPARILRKIETAMDTSASTSSAATELDSKLPESMTRKLNT